MQLRFPYISFFIFAIFYMPAVIAQKSRLTIQINNDRLRLGDTLDIIGTYKVGDKKLPPATLALVLKENNGKGIWQLRWPMIDGHAGASLVFPKGFTPGHYTMYFAVQARFFQLFGKVLYPPGIKKLTGTLSSPTIEPQQMAIPVKEGNFEIGKFIFENTALLDLHISPRKKMPAITIDAWLDSTFEPAAAVSKEITVGLDDTSVMENKKVDDWTAFFDPFYQTKILGDMPAAKKFDSVYVSPRFKKNIIQQFDCLGDSELVKSNSLEAFLAKHQPDFKMNPAYSENETPTAHAKEYNFVLYLDESATTYAVLNYIKLSDIASIKILPPASSMDFYDKKYNIVALYTKQGPFVTQDVYRYRYIINGYQPAIYRLPANSKMFATNPYFLY